MKLICEITEQVQFGEITEADGTKSLFIEGPFMQAGIVNKNGRIYKESILDREVERYTNDYVKNGRAFGELGHPQGPSINLERVSHLIKSIQKEGSTYVGKAKILGTPYGEIVKNLIAGGAKLGVSSRGMGSLSQNQDGINEVQDDFHLATAADIVADPSAPDAFVRGIMENVDWCWNNGVLEPRKIEEFKNTIQKTSKRNLEAAKIMVFERFLNELSK